MNNKRATSEQLEVLVTWVTDRPSMASGRCEGAEARIASKREWDGLAQTLNAIGFGAVKTGEKWQQSWRDIKNNAKKKASLHRVESCRTGGGIMRIPPLTPLEEKILAIMGPDPIEGMPIKETLFQPNEIELVVIDDVSVWDEEDVFLATPGPSSVKRKASDQGLFNKRDKIEVQGQHQLPCEEALSATPTPQRKSSCKALFNKEAMLERFLKAEEDKNDVERKKLLLEEKKIEKIGELGVAMLASMTALLASITAQRQEDTKFREALLAELLKRKCKI